MKKINKLLFALPLALLIVGCTKAANKVTTNKTTEKKTTLKDSTTKNTLRTTTAATTTEEDVFDILVVKNFEDAATIKGEGIFNLNSSTTISITLNYGYEYVGLFNGETQLTDKLTYEINDIKESINLYAIFKPVDYNVNVEQNIAEAGTLTGVGAVPYKNNTTIDVELAEEYLFVGLYDGETLLTDVLPYEIKSVTKDLNLNAIFKQKTYDVVVNQSLEDAAVIEGLGSFVKGSNTTIKINTNDGYNYLGLYDGETLLTNELTYNVTNITDKVELNALFSANSYKVTTSSDDTTLGSVTAIDDTYDCGSIIELKATPIEGYEVEGWYVNGTLYENYGKESTINFKTIASNCEVVVKFTIKRFTITVSDNIEGLGDCQIDYRTYSSDEDFTFDWGTETYYSIYNVLGYQFDYVVVNGETFESDYETLYIDKDYVIEIFYELADMDFYMLYERDLLSVNGGISIDVLPDSFETGVIDNSYSQFDGYTYASGTYKYQSVINITLKPKTNYYLEGLFDTYENKEVGTMENDVITLTIDDNYEYLVISLLGKICHIEVYSQDEVTGSATGTGDYHYGDKATICATANKGYKLVRWLDGNGDEYGVGYNPDGSPYVPNDIDVPLYGDATYIAVFEPDEFECYIHLVARNANRNVDYYVLTYLTEYDIHAPNVSGYTFAGWLENEDIDSLFSTENVLNYTMINEDVTLYAYYTPNSYTVTFNLDGGECSETSKTLVMGDNFTVEIPTKENLHFNGYYYYHTSETHYYDNDSTQLVYFIARIFNCNPADAESIIEREVVYVNDVLVTNSSTMVYRDDKVTIGDYLSGVKVVDKDGKSENVYFYPFDATFIAIWDALIIKKSNDGVADKEYYCELGKTISRFDTPERTGYTFKGWYVGDELYDFNSVVEHNLIIEAKWEIINYTVLYDSNNPSFGEITSTHSTAHYGDEVTLTFTAGDIYTFEYWYNRDTKEKIYSETITFIMPASDVRYRAYSTAFYLLVKTNDDSWGSVENDTIVARAGAELTLKAIPAEGYGFDHWEYEGEAFSTNAETTFIMPGSALSRVTAVFGKEITDKYERLGNKVWFGYYPQTCLNPNGQSGSNSALITELENIAGGFPTLDTKAHYEETKDNTNWINYDYEIYPNEKDWYKSEQKVNYETYQTYWEHTYYKAPHMWYIDIDYDGDGKYDYRGVLIYSYRNDEINKEKSSTNTDSTHQDDNHFDRSIVYNTYWFKYELIEWDVLENNDGTVKLIANLAIDSQNFSLSSNSYASSYIRDFLNDDFYNTAFNDLEKSIMNTMTIGSNNDFVTILTQEEATSYFENNADRTTQTTDYAMSQNCYVYSSPNIYNPTNDGNCYWLTRSAYTTSGNIYYVSYNGSITYGKTNMTYYGIRPVISITL